MGLARLLTNFARNVAMKQKAYIQLVYMTVKVDA